ncbi:MAG: O-antigen ligase family protein [Myxococcales bacterium]
MKAATRKRAAGRDAVAFAAVVGFTVSVYASIVHVFPFLEVVRPALLSAAVGFGALMIGRVSGGLPLTVDGVRGVALLGLCVWTALSPRWSVRPEVSARSALELIKLAGIYLTIINVVSSRKRLAILSGAAVIASLAPSLGTIDHWRNEIDLVEGFRAAWEGVYEDPNHLAMSLVAIVPVAAVFALHSPSILMRVLGALAAGTGVTAIILTHSRGGALGLALALTLWALSGTKKMRSLAAAIAVVAAVAIYAPSSFWTRTESISSFERDLSAQGRIWAWEVASAISKDRPIAGVGAGAFQFAWAEYAPRIARDMPLVAHNIFLAVLGELGLVGFALLMIFVGSALAGAAAAWKDPVAGGLARALSAGLAGYLLCDMLSGYVLSAHFFLLVALSASCERLIGQPEQVPSSRRAHRACVPAGGSRADETRA